MNLKVIHVVFIVCSILLCLLFGGWCLARGGGYTVVGIAAVVAGLGLVVYGGWFLRKMRDVGEPR